MGDIDESTRREDSEDAGIIEAGGTWGTEFDLETKTRSIGTESCRTTGRVIYFGSVERGARAGGMGDTKGVLGEGIQDATGIVEEFERFITAVGNSRDDLQVLQSVDLDVWGRGLDGQSWGSRDGDRGSNEDGERSTEEGGHRNVGSKAVGETTLMERQGRTSLA